jgi:hypothetical protein
MELHALADLEDILLAVLRDVPALSQARTDGTGAVDAAQRLEDRGRRHLADGGGGVLGRIEHRRLERYADHQPVLGRPLRQGLGAEHRQSRQRTGGAEQMTAGK